MKKYSNEKRFWVSTLLTAFLLTIGLGQTALNGSNVPYDVDFNSEVTILVEGNCSGASYDFGPDGSGGWLISNAEGDPANCNTTDCAANQGGAADNEFTTEVYDIQCLSGVAIVIDWEYSGGLEHVSCLAAGDPFGCGTDALSFWYNLDGAGNTLIEDVATCGDDSGTSIVTGLNGSTLQVNVIGGTQSVNEDIVINNITFNGLATGNEDCADAIEIFDGSNTGLDNFCDAVDGIVWYFYTATDDGGIQVDVTNNGGDPMLFSVVLACGDTDPITLPDATYTQSCVTSGESIWIGVGDDGSPGDDEFDLEITLIAPPGVGDIDFNFLGADGATDGTACEGTDFELDVNDPDDPLDGSWDYSWTQPDGTIIMNNPMLDVVAADPLIHDGIWTVTVTDANGCTGDDQIMISIGTAPVTNDTEIIACEDGVGSGTADFTLEDAEDGSLATNLGGISVDDAGGNTVLYFETLAEAIDGSITASTISSPYNAADGTIVYARIVDPVSGCFDVDVAEITLTVTPAPAVTISSDLPVCDGSDATFNESEITSISWMWTGDMGASFDDNTSQNPISNDLTDGETVTVTVTDINGCTSSSSEVVSLLPAPANNDCGSPEVAAVGVTSGTTDCANDDSNLCTPDHVVYFEFTTTEANATVLVEVNNGHAADVWIDCASGTPYANATACGSSITATCVPVGTTLYIPVGAADLTEGDFDLTITEDAGGVDNDSCDDPIPATPSTVCVAENFSGETAGACPESFGNNDCGQLDDPTIWFEFTVDPAATSVSFSLVTGSFHLYASSATCPPLTSISSCITGAMDITVTPGDTYLVSGTDAGGGTVSFDLTMNAAPANDMCIDAEDASGGSASGSTACATSDPNLCDASSAHVVYYTYTVAGPGTATVMIEVGGGDATDIVAQAWTDCGGTNYDNAIECGPSLMLDCVPAGTILTIPVGSADGGEGTFDLTITEDAGSGPANDLCDDAEIITIDNPCEAVSVSGTTVGACPETFIGGCTQDVDATVWFTFTSLTNTSSAEFTNVIGEFQIFTDCPATTSVGACITGPDNITISGSTQYWISATLNGDEGAVSFDISLLEAPDNDNCAGAEDASGGSATGTTGCASADGNFCGASGDHVVYYTYTVAGPGAVTVNIDVVADGATDIAAEAWTDCAAGTDFDDTVDCGLNLVLDCVPAGTVLTIPVGSADGGEGTFDLTITEDAGSGPANDLCDDAEIITIDNPCEAVSVSGTTVGACPETFIGGCTQDVDATVWFTFTSLTNTSSAEFTNVIGEFQIFTDCPATTSVGACITGPDNITISGSTQYWISATLNGDEGAVSFDISLLEAPDNDNCAGAEDASGGSATGTTGCASADGNFCGASGDHVVYYTYTVAGPGAVTVNIDVVADGATDIAAEAWTDCAAGTDFDDTIDCGLNLVLDCVPAGTVLTIPVGSTTGGEGTFDLTITEVPGSGPANDLCQDAEAIVIDTPCEPVGVMGSTVDACPEIFIADCTQDVDATVWFTFTTLANTTSAEFTDVTGEFQIFTDCPATATVSGCITGADNIPLTGATQYWISATLSGEEGDVSFDISLLEAPANDMCVDAEDASSGAVSGTTGCASTDDNFCAASGMHVVYYTYTVAGPGVVTVQIDVTAGDAGDIAVEAWEDCGGTDYDDSQPDCMASLTLDCVPPGTVLTIPVGSADEMAGTFDLAIMEVPGTVANDDCTGAELIVIDEPCVPVGVAGSTVDACPEAFTAGCTQDVDPTVWFTFTTLAGTTSAEFTNVVGEFQIITDCPATASLGDCVTGDIGIDVDASTTYWITGTLPGAEGDISFDIALLEAPDNDVCDNAFGASSTTVVGNNGCASADGNLCGGTDHVVYYTYTVAGPGSVTLEITVNELTASGISFAAFVGCGGALMDESCDADGTLEIPCVAEGTEVIIAIGTAEGNTGDFDITVGEVVDGTGPPNDDCSNAEPHIAPECIEYTISGSTTDACPEFVTGCTIDVDPTVWFEVTLPPGTTTVDFLDLTNGVNLALFDICNGTNISCIMGEELDVMDLPETFYVAAVIPGGEGSFDFTIFAQIPPANDFCADAIEGGGSGTTCCSTNDDIGCAQENSVWYSYTPTDPNAAVIVMAEAGDISGMSVDVWTGDCAGLTPVDGGECVSSSSIEIPVTCSEGATVFVQISSSSEANCGTHTVSFLEEIGCDQGLTCDVASEQSMAPITNGGQVCLSSCNLYTCDVACGDNTVWFEVTTDADASILNIQLTTDFEPSVCVIADNCAGDLVYSGVGDIANAAVVGNFTYLIGVGVASGDAGDIDICVQTFLQLVECAASVEIEPTRPEYPDSNPEGPYCPGEVVNFCYTVDYTIGAVGDPDGNNCQWIQGIIPVVGCGWDSDLNDIADQPPAGWNWLGDGEVDYNVSNPILSLSSECCGGLGLEYGGGGLGAGDGLPAGFWFTSPGGAGCANTGDPDTMWGLPGGCGSSQSVDFCFDLTVRNVTDPSECDDDCNSDLKIHIFTFADGETGCWSSAVCAGDVPITFDAFMDCSSLVTVELVDGLEEICSGQSPGLKLEANDGFSTIIMQTEGNPNITGNANEGAFPGGEACITDVLVNSGTDPEIIVYEFFAQSPNPDSECNGPKIFVEVTVFPDIVIEFDEPYDVCWDGQEEIIPTIIGGSGTYVSYEWSNGDVTPTTFAPQTIGDAPGPYLYTLTVTDDLGCTEDATVEFIIRPEVVHLVNGTSDFACIDGQDNFESFCAVIQSGGANGPFNYTWIYDSDLIIDEDDDCITIDEENSEPGFYEINLEIEDVYGCIYFEGPVFFSVDNGPEIEQSFPFCLPDGFGGVEYSFEVCDNNGGASDWSLYDESQFVLLDGPYSGNCATFIVAPFVAGDDVPVIFTVEAIDLGTGCIAYEEVTIEPPAIPEIPETIEGCTGEEVTIFLDNFTDFEDVTWCDGFSSGPSFDLILEDSETCFVTVFDLNGCELTYEIEIIVSGEADVEISGSTSFCAGSSTTLCATSDPGYDYTWSNGETTECIVVTMAGTYTVDVDTGSCTASDAVDVVEGADLVPIVNGGDLCSGGSVLLSTGNSFGDYVWTDAAQNIILPTASGPWEIEVFVGGVYTVEVTDGACSGSGMITVVEQTPPTADIASAQPCNSGDSGGETVLDLSTLVTNATGAVTILSPSGAPLVPTTVNYDGLAAGDIVYTVVVEGTDPCMDAMYDLTVNVANCGCPDLTLNSFGNPCNGDGTTLQLYNFLGQFAETDGSFSILDAGGVLAVVQPDAAGNLLIDESFPAGVYTLVYTLNNPDPNCPDSNSITFEVFGIPQPVINTPDSVCNSDAAGDETTLDLGLIVTNAAGDWEDADGNLLTSTIIDFNGVAVGTVTYFFNTTGASGPCNNFSIPIIVNVIDCNCPVLNLDPLPSPMCQTDDEIDLATFQNDSDPGQWTVEGPDPSFTLSGSVFDPEGQPGGTYTFTYTLNSPGPITCDNLATATIELSEAIELPILQSLTACSVDVDNSPPTFLDLTDIPELIGFSGEWTAPDNYNDGVLPDPSNVVFLDTLPGSFFFTFTTDNADAPCDNVSVDLLINVSDCACPEIILSPQSVCNDDGEVNLSSSIGFTAPGTFTYDSGPVGNVTLSGNDFDATGAEAGDYIFLYTLDDPVDNCPETGTVTITVFEQIIVDVEPSATVCAVASTQGDTFFDFIAAQGLQLGNWEAPDNYPDAITDFSNVSFLDFTPGESYTFTFNGFAQGECDATSDELTISVIDCDCPNISIAGEPELCNDGDDYLLTDLEDDNIVAGTLSAESAAGDNIDIPGDVFDATGLDEGTYLVIFTPDVAPPSDCPQQDTVYITVVAPPSAGVFTAPAMLCEEDGDLITLADLLEDETAGGSWQETSSTSSTGGTFDDEDGTFNTVGQAPGTYTFEYMFDTSNSPCDPVSETVVVEIEATPNADAGAGGTIDCDNNMVILGGSGTSAGAEYLYYWLNPAGDTIYSGTTLEFTSMEGGDWTLIVENIVTGCSETSVASILLDNDVPNFQFSSTNSPCFGDNAGTIEVNNIIGGSPPFEFQLNDGSFGTTQVWENLGPGNYTVTMLDALGCSAVRTTIIAEPGPITFDVGSDLIVEVGESVTLGFENSNLGGSTLQTVTWTENGEIICEGSNIDGTLDACLNIDVSPPLIPTEYCLEVVTAEGCIQTECRSLQALDVRDVYFPNVISGWDQEATANTTFYVHSDEFVESIPSFAIYDRWGELIHSYENGFPNDPEWGWDGRFNGSAAAQGVYVYLIELAYAGGETEIFTGTVTVTR